MTGFTAFVNGARVVSLNVTESVMSGSRLSGKAMTSNPEPLQLCPYWSLSEPLPLLPPEVEEALRRNLGDALVHDLYLCKLVIVLRAYMAMRAR